MDDAPEQVYADAYVLRQRFAELGILAQLSSGELLAEVRRDSPAMPSRGPLPGTRSQLVFYRRGELLVAIVHQYLLPDGRIGASGLPDPKWLRDGHRILKYRSTH